MAVKITTKTKTAETQKKTEDKNLDQGITSKRARVATPVKKKTAKPIAAAKKPAVIKAAEELARKPEPKTLSQTAEKYYESVGRRKESTARVRVYTKKSTDVQISEDRALIEVNGKPYYEYFKAVPLQNIVEAPLRKLKSLNRFKATVRSFGGGIHGQADAIKHGLSRALVLFDANFSKKLRKAGYLTRDSREKERRKYGLKKARKAPQWAKR